MNLPTGRTIEHSESYGTVIKSPGIYGGFVTVDEKIRNFKIGMCKPHECGNYAGRGWKDRLYADAIAALEAAMR